MKNELLQLHIQIHPFFNYWASCLETGRAKIPKINPNLYSVSRFYMLKYVVVVILKMIERVFFLMTGL